MIRIALIGLLLSGCNMFPQYECISEAKVVDIVSVNYRTVTVMTDKGAVDLVQPRDLVVGKVICLELGKL